MDKNLERHEMFDLVKTQTPWSDVECNTFIDKYIKEQLTIELNNLNKIKSDVEFIASLNGPQKAYYLSIENEFNIREIKLREKDQKIRDKEQVYKSRIDNLLTDLEEIKLKIVDVIRNKGNSD